MAFENINWGMQSQAARQDQNILLDAIGRGIANYQNAQEMDLRKQQIANQAKKPPDFESIAMGAVYKQQLGLPVTPEEQAAIGTMAATSSPRQYVDQLGQIVTQPSPWQSLMGGAPVAPVQRTPFPASGGNVSFDGMSMDNSPEAIASAMGVPVGDIMAAQGNVAEYKPILTKEQFEEKKGIQPVVPELPERYKNTPVGEKMAWDAQKDFSIKEWENEIKVAANNLKTEQGKATVSGILDRMDALNDELKAREGIVVGGDPLRKRIQAYFSTTGIGQEGRKILDPETQALAEEFRNLQSTLLPFYASAAGLGAKSIDSEGERKSILDSFGSPSGVYQANQRQFNNLRQTFEIPKRETRMQDMSNSESGATQQRRPQITPEQAREILRQRGKL